MSLNLSQIKPAAKSSKKTKRVGRGNGSGMGTYSCRGQKGQGSRTGKKFKSWFEGGQTSFLQRLPKLKGFKNPNYKEYQAINLELIEKLYNEGEVVNAETLTKKNLIKNEKSFYKILGEGKLTKKIEVVTHKISTKAKEAVEKIGGTVTILKKELKKDVLKK